MRVIEGAVPMEPDSAFALVLINGPRTEMATDFAAPGRAPWLEAIGTSTGSGGGDMIFTVGAGATGAGWMSMGWGLRRQVTCDLAGSAAGQGVGIYFSVDACGDRDSS